MTQQQKKSNGLEPYDDLRDDVDDSNYPLNTADNPQSPKRVSRDEWNKHEPFPYDPEIHNFERPKDEMFLPDAGRSPKALHIDFLTRLGIKAFVLFGIYLLTLETNIDPLLGVGLFGFLFMSLLVSPLADNYPDGFPKTLIIISLIIACFGYTNAFINMDEYQPIPTNKFCDDAPNVKNCIKIQ